MFVLETLPKVALVLAALLRLLAFVSRERRAIEQGMIDDETRDQVVVVEDADMHVGSPIPLKVVDVGVKHESP